MNQRAFVELLITKNEMPFRMLLPIGAQWSDAHAAALECADEILKFQKELEAQAEAQKEAAATELVNAEPIEAEVAE